MITSAAQEQEHYLNASYGLKSWLLTKDHKRIALVGQGQFAVDGENRARRFSVVEGSQTAGVLLGRESMARSSAGLTVRVDRTADEARRIQTHVVRARASNQTARLDSRTTLPVRMAVHV